MNNTIKQFATLISNFVEKIFVPALESKTKENLRVIEQWEGLKALINDQDQI